MQTFDVKKSYLAVVGTLLATGAVLGKHRAPTGYQLYLQKLLPSSYPKQRDVWERKA